MLARGEGVDLAGVVVQVPEGVTEFEPSDSRDGDDQPHLRRALYGQVSVSRHNLVGHSASATIETLRRAGTSIFRTDQCGAGTITSGAADRLVVDTSADLRLNASVNSRAVSAPLGHCGFLLAHELSVTVHGTKIHFDAYDLTVPNLQILRVAK
jgi:hypothetical protein